MAPYIWQSPNRGGSGDWSGTGSRRTVCQIQDFLRFLLLPDILWTQGGSKEMVSLVGPSHPLDQKVASLGLKLGLRVPLTPGVLGTS